MNNLLTKLTPSRAFLPAAGLGCFLLAFLFQNFFPPSLKIQKYTRQIQQQIRQKEQRFRKLVNDTAVVQAIASSQYDPSLLHSIRDDQVGFHFFLYQNEARSVPRLLFWNGYAVRADEASVQPGPERLLSLKNGVYVQQTIPVTLGKKKYWAVALFPVLHKYFLEIENLQTEFDGVPQAADHVYLSDRPTPFAVLSSKGKQLFYLRSSGTENPTSPLFFYIFLVLGTLFSTRWIQEGATQLAQRNGVFMGLGFLVMILFILRALTYTYPDLLQLRHFELFSPEIYQGGVWLNSLGDLLINAFLLLWIALFAYRGFRDWPMRFPRQLFGRTMITLLLLVALVWGTFQMAAVVQSLVTDAEISFKVTDFFSLNVYSFVAFLILATLGVSYFLLAQNLLRMLRACWPWQSLLLYVLMSTLGLALLTFTRDTALIELNLMVLIWLLLFSLLLNSRYLSGVKFRLNISELLFWLFFFSFSMAAVIVMENRKYEQGQRRLFAQKLSQQAEPSNERLLNIALTYLDQDFLNQQFDRFTHPIENAQLKDSLLNKNFNAFLNAFDTRIYVFDGALTPQPLFNEDPATFETLNTIYNNQGKETSIPDLRYFERSFDRFSYISRKEVVHPGDQVIRGYLFVLAEPRRYKKDALVPALFRQSREALLPEYSSSYAYAVYLGGELVDHYNHYEFPTHLEPRQIPVSEYELRRQNDYVELWYRKTKNNVVIIAKKDNYFLESITLFAYFFTLFLLLIAFYGLGRILVQSRFRWTFFRDRFRFSIRNQIHSTIIAVSLISFIVIGASTILFFISRYRTSNQEVLSRNMQIMVNQMQNKLKEEAASQRKASTANAEGKLVQLMQELSEIHGTDVNLFDTTGQLQVASRPLIYAKGVLSTLMNPEAWYSLHLRSAVQSVQNERMGKVDYISMYNPLRDPEGTVIGYLNVPSYNTQGDLRQEISNFIVTLINLNAFIFLIAGAISLLITNRITLSFSLIGRKMQDINLGRMNQEISWDRQDEIGQLVREYNKMVTKLDESAAALAKSERESAWRQMARQVAHEIKNPLTPMKLSIQYLQKAINQKSVNIKELTESVARTLVEQIDHLSKIASDFSQFANIGNPHNEIFDVHDVLNSLSLLYGSTPQVHFEWNPVPQRVIIFADKTQVNRLFTNLLQNAVEAAAHRNPAVVNMWEETEGSYIRINIQDNGEGIAADMLSKIFTPNFTTKTSGTGLGLAMCKSIVENIQGEIGFQTEVGAGSTFYVRLPMFR